MKKSIIVTLLLTLIPTAIATPIDFDNLYIASTAYGTVGGEGYPRLLAAYNNDIYFIVSDDGTANPSKVCRYNPSNGLSNAVNHSIVAETTGRFVTLRQINNLLYFSDNLGNVYSYDGSTFTAMSGTPFTADNYVYSIAEFKGLKYFATSAGNIYRYGGVSFEPVRETSENRIIIDMGVWQKDGYLYVSVGPRKDVCCPPTGYVIRSSSGDAGSWETVLDGNYYSMLFMPTADYLYTAVLDDAGSHSSTIRKSNEGTTFPVIYPSDGQYKRAWGSFYCDGIAYFFTDDSSYGFGQIIVDDNGSVNRTVNQRWTLTQAVELNHEIYALASSTAGEQQGDVYLITTSTLAVVSPDGGEEFISGKTETVTWKALDSIENVSIEYSASNGLSWQVIDANTPNDGEHDWTLPAVTSNQCLIRIRDVNNANVYDTSDDAFTIYECHLSSLADLNRDCKVDLVDFALLAQDWLRNGNPFDQGYTEGPDGMVWVSINDPGVDDTGDGIPDHEGFKGYMSKYETTNAQYCQFLNAALASGDVIVDGNYANGASGSNSGTDFGGQPYYNLADPGWTGDGATNGGAARINYTGSSFTVDSGFENHPVTCVSWYGATAFCTYYGYRLPTEWEWQAVADYDGSYTYGCGTSIMNSMANLLTSTHPDGTTIVGAFETYGHGMCDMDGNVFEWTSSVYSGSSYVLRGGGWRDAALTVSYRDDRPQYYSDINRGFRVCR